MDILNETFGVLDKRNLLWPQVGSKTFLATISILPVFCTTTKVRIVFVKFFWAELILILEDVKLDSF